MIVSASHARNFIEALLAVHPFSAEVLYCTWHEKSDVYELGLLIAAPQLNPSDTMLASLVTRLQRTPTGKPKHTQHVTRLTIPALQGPHVLIMG